MENSEAIKSALLNACHELVDQRIANAQQAMNAAQESANMEEKSSAGDKYETGRAMAQLERDKAVLQLHEAMQLKQTLSKLNIKLKGHQVIQGSLVITDKSNFFIAISLGKLMIAQKDYFVIAPGTPIGKLLMGASTGSEFLFNGQLHTIREIL